MDSTLSSSDTAARLSLALTRLKARLREKSSLQTAGLSLSQISILQRLRLGGPSTATDLAMTEHVTQ